ncbi:ATPase [Occultella glacieicola]|uniref:ATPase n=1 Tax=Occultella glacieicola TaxID=2518684 RepID=A0ABY2DXK7_9MICO|nr:SRPBCC family protein [Occultella glacieicola]TDE88883.1 ATPase [Occultella glacieicola]
MSQTTTKGTAVLTLPSDTEILVTREFNAPRHLVYRVFTEPDLIRRWWAGQRGNVTVAEVDLRVGGAWRYALVAEGGFEVGFHGEYHEIVPDERIVCTEIFEGMPGGEGAGEATLITYTFAETDGRTTLEVLTACNSKETRDVIISSGMEVGMQEGYDLVEELAVELDG